MVSLVKLGLKAFTRTSIAARVVANFEATTDARPNILRVLTYHRIDYADKSSHLYPGTLSASPEEFQLQMEILAERYHIVSLPEVLSAVRGDHALPPKSLLITFDDAYCDFGEHAWPVLKALSMPAVLFVPTAFPGDRQARFWWDRLHQAACRADALATTTDIRRFRSLVKQIKALPHADALTLVDQHCEDWGEPYDTTSPVMTWDQLRELTQDGLDLAAHTCTHPLMNRIGVSEAVAEATQSRNELFQQIGVDFPALAYPGGAFSRSLLQPLMDAGFEIAFTTRRGINNLETANPLLLRRINVATTTPLTMIRAQLLAPI